MVRELIRRELAVRLRDVSAGSLLHKLGLSPQRPVRRAFQQNQPLVVDWMAKDFPRIKKMTLEAGADIFFGDEASVRSDYHSGTTWAPRARHWLLSCHHGRAFQGECDFRHQPQG